MYENPTVLLKICTVGLPTKVVYSLKRFVQNQSRLTENERMVQHCATDSPELHFSGFEFRVCLHPASVALPKLESPIYPAILPIARYIYVSLDTCSKDKRKKDMYFEWMKIYLLCRHVFRQKLCLHTRYSI